MLYREIIPVCSHIHTKHINTQCGQNVELYIKTQSVPCSKHSVSVIKTSQLMLYREIIAVCSQIYTKHINTLCGQNVGLLNLTAGGTYIFHWPLNCYIFTTKFSVWRYMTLCDHGNLRMSTNNLLPLGSGLENKTARWSDRRCEGRKKWKKKAISGVVGERPNDGVLEGRFVLALPINPEGVNRSFLRKVGMFLSAGIMTVGFIAPNTRCSATYVIKAPSEGTQLDRILKLSDAFNLYKTHKPLLSLQQNFIIVETVSELWFWT